MFNLTSTCEGVTDSKKIPIGKMKHYLYAKILLAKAQLFDFNQIATSASF